MSFFFSVFMLRAGFNLPLFVIQSFPALFAVFFQTQLLRNGLGVTFGVIIRATAVGAY